METNPAVVESNAPAVINLDQDALAAIADNMSGESLSASDLDRLRVPSGGGQSWEVQTLTGPEERKEVRGVVLMSKSGRAFYEREFSGEKNPPDCISLDFVQGIGSPGGACAACPLNQYESAAKGKGKACKETRTVMVLMDGDLLPTVLRVPPSSLKAWRSYVMRLSKRGIRLQHVVTSMTLAKAKSSDGIAYSEIVFSAAAVIPPEQRSVIDNYIARFSSAFEAAHADSVAERAGSAEPTAPGEEKNPFAN